MKTNKYCDNMPADLFSKLKKYEVDDASTIIGGRLLTEEEMIIENEPRGSSEEIDNSI